MTPSILSILGSTLLQMRLANNFLQIIANILHKPFIFLGGILDTLLLLGKISGDTMEEYRGPVFPTIRRGYRNLARGGDIIYEQKICNS